MQTNLYFIPKKTFSNQLTMRAHSILLPKNFLSAVVKVLEVHHTTKYVPKGSFQVADTVPVMCTVPELRAV